MTVALKCGVLAIIRHNYLGVEYARRLSKCQVIGHSLEVTVVFRLLHADCLEEESFSIHVHTQDSHFPLTRCHFCLPNLKLAPLVQVSQQSASECHILHEMPIERGQSVLFGIDRYLPLHGVENPGFKGRRLKIRVWSEG